MTSFRHGHRGLSARSTKRAEVRCAGWSHRFRDRFAGSRTVRRILGALAAVVVLFAAPAAAVSPDRDPLGRSGGRRPLEPAISVAVVAIRRVRGCICAGALAPV